LSYNISFIQHSFHGKTWAQQIDLFKFSFNSHCGFMEYGLPAAIKTIIGQINHCFVRKRISLIHKEEMFIVFLII